MSMLIQQCAQLRHKNLLKSHLCWCTVCVGLTLIHALQRKHIYKQLFKGIIWGQGPQFVLLNTTKTRSSMLVSYWDRTASMIPLFTGDSLLFFFFLKKINCILNNLQSLQSLGHKIRTPWPALHLFLTAQVDNTYKSALVNWCSTNYMNEVMPMFESVERFPSWVIMSLLTCNLALIILRSSKSLVNMVLE